MEQMKHGNSIHYGYKIQRKKSESERDLDSSKEKESKIRLETSNFMRNNRFAWKHFYWNGRDFEQTLRKRQENGQWQLHRFKFNKLIVLRESTQYACVSLNVVVAF